ncbi:hypothetical protein CesoFtcFv8_000073 [Champsocephalus esox]|uniref:RPGR-interacting protein 1 first C2 domain-containing protein n=1 Tax=Champsocephalus esox TaxID=159716 RepID=A0AAN8HXR4_9TELE|nr:hypothetical protein CesoFtcFv8_000073 [Champsocephalus esox]
MLSSRLSLSLSLSSDVSLPQNARERQDVSKVSREELEDRFLRLHEETLLLKQKTHAQDDKIRKLGTKLMRLLKDRGRMERLAGGQAGGQLEVRLRCVCVTWSWRRQQLLTSHSRRSPYGRVQSRVNTGVKKDDAPSLTHLKSPRSPEGGRPPTGLLPRFGHSLLEETRAEVRNLENMMELQRSHMEEMELEKEELREELRRREEELRRREEEYKEKLLQNTSRLRAQVSSNIAVIKLQKQLQERSSSVSELEGRFIQLQESQRTLRLSHDAALLKVDELSTQLKDERKTSLELESKKQSAAISRQGLQQLQERVGELEQERDLLKDSNEKLVNSALDVSWQQRFQLQEQKMKMQISQLETALQADLVDKNQILDKIKMERESSEKLTEENRKLQIQFLEQKQRLEETNDGLKFYSRENKYDVAELTEALLLIKKRKSSGELGFLQEKEQEEQEEVQELRAAHAETIQELQKTRSLLSMESSICRDYKVELQAVLQKMEADGGGFAQQLQRQAALLDTRAARIKKLEAQLRDVAYGSKAAPVSPLDGPDEEEDDEELLQRGENLLELQLLGASLSSSALQQALGDQDSSTFSSFCTYSFHLSELHCTPLASGSMPRYGFTSRFVVSVDEGFLQYLRHGAVKVELHQALGVDWRTLAGAKIPLQGLLEAEGALQGSAPLLGRSEGTPSFGSLEYRLRLRVPMKETLRLHRDQLHRDQLHRDQLSADQLSADQLSAGPQVQEKCQDIEIEIQ